MAGRRDNGAALSVVGGIVYPRSNSRLAKGQFSWPFARLLVTDAGVVLGPRRPLSALTRPLAVRFNDLDRVEIQSLPAVFHRIDIGMRMRFRASDPRVDRVSFWSWRGSMKQVLQTLGARGVRIEEVPLSRW
jgi:hypothetical protein